MKTIPRTVMITSTIVICKWLLIMIVLITLTTNQHYPSARVVLKSWTSLHDSTALVSSAACVFRSLRCSGSTPVPLVGVQKMLSKKKGQQIANPPRGVAVPGLLQLPPCLGKFVFLSRHICHLSVQQLLLAFKFLRLKR